jgi:hypothetical protein
MASPAVDEVAVPGLFPPALELPKSSESFDKLASARMHASSSADSLSLSRDLPRATGSTTTFHMTASVLVYLPD